MSLLSFMLHICIHWDHTSGLYGLSHPIYLFLAPPAYLAQGAAASPVPPAHLLMACIGWSGHTGGKHSQSIPFFLLHSHSTFFYSIFKCSSYPNLFYFQAYLCTEPSTSPCWCLHWQGPWAIQHWKGLGIYTHSKTYQSVEKMSMINTNLCA